jgi:hypothetical protein
MAKYTVIKEVVEVLTFEEFVEYGRKHSDNIVEGVPLSFMYKGCPVTHEDDKCYLIKAKDNRDYDFTPDEVIVSNSEGKVYLMDKQLFYATHEKLE